jgi:hypothetical protein
MRFYCKNNAYNYFREYIESILLENDKIILFEDNDIIEISDDNISNIFISYIPNLNLIKFKNENNNIINFFYLNTEQLTRDDMKNFVGSNVKSLIEISKSISNLKISILDYSMENIELFKKLKILDDYKLNIYHIPYQYNEKEISKLKKIKNGVKKLYDFSFSGTLSDYRNIIINQLKKNNITINIVDGWYNERDLKIGKSKILLNIHYNKNYNIYESIRCDRWIFSENLVLTETSYKNDSLDLKDFMISTAYENLYTKANEITKNLSFFENSCFSQEKLILLKKVINNRKEIYENFRKNFK